jgi:hypothetical protein
MPVSSRWVVLTGEDAYCKILVHGASTLDCEAREKASQTVYERNTASYIVLTVAKSGLSAAVRRPGSGQNVAICGQNVAKELPKSCQRVANSGRRAALRRPAVIRLFPDRSVRRHCLSSKLGGLTGAVARPASWGRGMRTPKSGGPQSECCVSDERLKKFAPVRPACTNDRSRVGARASATNFPFCQDLDTPEQHPINV